MEVLALTIVTGFICALVGWMVWTVSAENKQLRQERQEMWEYFMMYKATNEDNFEGGRLMAAVQREKNKQPIPSAGDPEKPSAGGLTIIEGLQ